MRRLCFDTESDRYQDYRGVLNPGQFRCAVVYDEESQEYIEFREHQAAELVSLLATADELISHNGPGHDFPMLENVCGEDRVAPLRHIKHHDLSALFSRTSLDDLAPQHIPEDRLAGIEQNRRNRIEQANNRWPAIRPNFYPPERFIEKKLAKARFDVERTYLVFKAYLAVKK